LTDDDAIGSRANNFDLLRFLAAALVIVSHSFVLTGSTFEPLASVTGGFDTLGGLGVAIFFVMSGFLITQSWTQDPRPRAFFAKRLLRIAPALMAAVILAVFVLGALESSLGPRRYFSEPATWAYLWNLSLFRMRYFLPGVFEANPFTSAVNGSLWTIPIEVGCYVAVGALGWLGLFPRRLLAFVILLGLILVDWRPAAVWSEHGQHLLGPWARSYARYASYFFAGAFLYLMPRQMTRSPAVSLVAGVVLLACLGTSYAQPVGRLTIPILVLFASWIPVPALQGFGRFGDFSYGMYVYAFPIQQWLIEAVPLARTPAGLLALSFTASLAAAAASWHLLEAPALRWKARIAPPRPATLGG
jgi:peptidoglycan/LPS O-acetylase OafA/YrhL